MDVDAIVRALEGSQPVAGRQRVLQTAAGVTVVDDAYNANPDSMRASLAMFASMDVPGRRIAVLGDMGELGDYTEEGHASMGAFAASLPIAHLVCVGELSRTMAQRLSMLSSRITRFAKRLRCRFIASAPPRRRL
jgi:UDP-N-acetylmuramoyl-tripeptide--D-alanyl-D-alanine ligase